MKSDGIGRGEGQTIGLRRFIRAGGVVFIAFPLHEGTLRYDAARMYSQSPKDVLDNVVALLHELGLKTDKLVQLVQPARYDHSVHTEREWVR